MKRAEVRKAAAPWMGWKVLVLEPDGVHFERFYYPTHEVALAHALSEVGLGIPPEHREAP